MAYDPTQNPHYQTGYRDAAEAVRESGCADDPADGWDGWLINSVGYAGVRQALDLPADCQAGSKAWEDALSRYVAGARQGAADQFDEIEATFDAE